MDNEKKAKRNIKDSVFASIFSRPRYTRELLFCLTGEEVDEDDIEIVTIENIICNGSYNDLGILVRGKDLYLVEAQSTKCPNLVFRINDYYLRTLRRGIKNYSSRQYGSVAIAELYTPHFFSIYTGTDGIPEYYETKNIFILGQSLKIRVKNFTRNNSEGIIRAYIVWCRKYDELCLDYGRTAETVAMAIDFCLEAEETKELREFMLENRAEVEMIIEENNAQEIVMNSLIEEGRERGREEGREKGREEGREKGREEGREEERKSILENLKTFFKKTGFEENLQDSLYENFVAFLS